MAARSIIGFVLFAAVSSAQAYYASMEPPANWRPKKDYPDGFARVIILSATVPGNSTRGAPALYIGPNDASGRNVIVQGTPEPRWLWELMPGTEAHAFVPAAVYGAGVLVQGAIRVGGRSVAVPAFAKFASGAARDGARQGFAGAAAGVFGGMLAAAGLSWLWDQLNGWTKPDPNADLSDGWEYQLATADGGKATGWHGSKSAACSAGVNVFRPPTASMYWEARFVSGQCSYLAYYKSDGSRASTYDVTTGLSYRQRSSSCPAGSYQTPAGCMPQRPRIKVTEEEFVDKVSPLPWPDNLPEQLPNGVPVDDPVINPGPSPWDPAKPYRDPIGDPVPNPSYDPTKDPSVSNPPRIQPTRRIVPSPTPDDPWRVDIRPVDEPIVGPNEVTNPKPDPTKPPADPASSPSPAQDGTKDKVPLLCDVFPNISACQPLGDAPKAENLQDKQINVSITPDGGFGPDNAACPADRVFGKGWTFSFSQVCTFASGVRPVVIAFAWLAAGLMVVGVARKN